MENPDQNPSAETGPWLTGRILEQLRHLSKIGIPLMVLCAILGISAALLSLVYLHTFWFYVRTSSSDQLLPMISFMVTAAMLFFFTKGVTEGIRAWKLLKIGAQDDQALLEGSERLAKMFRWFSIWAGVFISSSLVFFS